MANESGTGWRAVPASPSPAPAGPSGGSRWRRAAQLVAVALSVVIVVLSGTAWLGFQHYAADLRRIDNVFPSANRPAQSAAGSENFLLVGSDRRDQLSKADQRKYHLGHDAGRRSDTMIILHISKQRNRAVLISLPRDSYVEIPAYTDAQGHRHPAQHNKLNAAYSYGGPRLTVATVEKATGVRIDHYVEINVLGFAKMVDALGGVDVCLSQPANDPKSGLHLPAGHTKVNGVQGLAFVRARKTLGDGSDLGRIKRQQQFLGSMLRKAMSIGILLDPGKLDKFLNAALAAVRVDRELTVGDLRTLALTMRHLDPKHVTFATVPLADTDYRPGGVGSTVLWDSGLASGLFNAVNHDRPINAASFKPRKVTVPPAQVTVRVLNGTSSGGLAGRVTAAFQAGGFRTEAAGNADNHDYARTVIRYAPSETAAAQTVKAALPDATLQPDASAGGTVVVVLGSSYAGVQPVTVSGTGSGSSAGGKPSIPTTTAADNPCAKS
jgi:LCP family protein required for cell wall assembly